MRNLTNWSFALLAGIIVSSTVGGKAANAQTAHTILVPFVGVVHDTCQMQNHVQDPVSTSASHEASICETQQETLSLAETTASLQDDPETRTFYQEPVSATSGDDTLIRLTTVVR